LPLEIANGFYRFRTGLSVNVAAIKPPSRQLILDRLQNALLHLTRGSGIERSSVHNSIIWRFAARLGFAVRRIISWINVFFVAV
jgi:hypothetical protein